MEHRPCNYYQVVKRFIGEVKGVIASCKSRLDSRIAGLDRLIKTYGIMQLVPISELEEGAGIKGKRDDMLPFSSYYREVDMDVGKLETDVSRLFKKTYGRKLFP